MPEGERELDGRVGSRRMDATGPGGKREPAPGVRMWSLEEDGSLHLTGAGTNTETALDLHWENTDGVLCRVDSIPGRWPYLQYLNMEGQRVADIGALGASLSLRELIASGNQLADVSPLSSCLLLARLDLNDNCIEELPAGFCSLVMLQQLLVAGVCACACDIHAHTHTHTHTAISRR